MTPTLEVHPHRRLPRPPRLEARLFFRGRWPQDRRLQLGLEAIGGPADWTASVSVAGGPPTSLSLKPGRHWSIVELPPGVRRARVLVVSAAMPSENARFLIHDLAFVPAGAPFSPGPVPLDPVPRLVQSGPSAVRFAALLPPRPVLRFTPSAAGATEPVRFRVSFEGMDEGSRDLWSATVAPGSNRAGEVTLRLPEVGHEPVRIGLHIDGTSPGLRGVWLAPRILGHGKGPSLRPRPYASAVNSLADPLREQLRGVNVLVVLMDAARASHLGCYGYDRPTTPEIDRLAREGVVFERAYAPAPFTVASVSSMWTSLYPDAHHYGVRHDASLPPEHTTLAEVLAEREVATAGFVANPSGGAPFGLARGFGEFHHLYEDGGDRSFSIPGAPEFRPGLRRWLEQVRGRRFFGYVHYIEPHFPYDPPPPFDLMFGSDEPLAPAVRRDDTWVRRVNAGRVRPSPEEVRHLVRLYDGNLAFVDREIGWLRRTLEELGLLENTVIVVTSDHGEDLYERGLIGHGGLVNEESLHIPLVVRFPAGRGLAGLRIGGLVDLLDVAPTLADLFEVPASSPGARGFQGRSLLPLLAGAEGKSAVLGRTMQERPTYALSDGTWKLVYSVRSGRTVLYDLARDPEERQNVAADHPRRAELLRQELLRWLAEVRTRRSSASQRSLTPEEIEMLRSLGYMP
jgi:arylsulfatase A-like enzyme